mgnify:CR=1 FL=1
MKELLRRVSLWGLPAVALGVALFACESGWSAPSLRGAYIGALQMLHPLPSGVRGLAAHTREANFAFVTIAGLAIIALLISERLGAALAVFGGALVVTLIHGAITYPDGTSYAGTVSVGNPDSANVGYLDIDYTPVTGTVLDAQSIVDLDPEFVLDGPGKGTAALANDIAPLRLTGTNTFRYFVRGEFAPGEVTISFLKNTFFSGFIDAAGLMDAAGRVGNLASSDTGAVDRFTVATLSATLADPAINSQVNADLLNKRGFFDVVLPLSGFAQIDISSVTDLDPEFDVTASQGVDFRIDGTQAPVFLGEASGGYKFRYWYTGTYEPGQVQLTLKAGSFNHLDANGTAIANAAGSGASVHVVHLNSSARAALPAMLEMIAGARQRGIDVTTEAYPYTAEIGRAHV